MTSTRTCTVSKCLWLSCDYYNKFITLNNQRVREIFMIVGQDKRTNTNRKLLELQKECSPDGVKSPDVQRLVWELFQQELVESNHRIRSDYDVRLERMFVCHLEYYIISFYLSFNDCFTLLIWFRHRLNSQQSPQQRHIYTIMLSWAEQCIQLNRSTFKRHQTTHMFTLENNVS